MCGCTNDIFGGTKKFRKDTHIFNKTKLQHYEILRATILQHPFEELQLVIKEGERCIKF